VELSVAAEIDDVAPGIDQRTVGDVASVQEHHDRDMSITHCSTPILVDKPNAASSCLAARTGGWATAITNTSVFGCN
jgi:hypothetical protein